MNASIAKTSVDYTCWTDEDLFLEYRVTGNRELFEVLVHRYENELFSFLNKKMGNREAAEDVFQLSFLQIHIKSSLFEEGRRFRPWLYSVASNQAIDYLRKNNRRSSVSLDSPVAGEEEGDALGALIESNDIRPSESAEQADEIAFVREAVRHLPEAYRLILERTCFRGMTYQQVADELGLPLKTVASRVIYAKKRLAAALSVHVAQQNL